MSLRVDRTELWSYLRARALPIAAVVLVQLSLVALIASMLGSYLTGLTQGAVLVGDLALLLLSVQASSYSPPGNRGYDATISVLAAARRRRLIWGWVSNIAVDGGDIGHLVVTREGGLVAIQATWHGEEPTAEVVAANALAAQQASVRAVTVLRSLRLPTDLTTLMVLWGSVPSHPHLAVTRRLGDLDVVSGPDLLTWLRGLDGIPSDKATAREILADLEGYGKGAETGRPRPGLTHVPMPA